MGPFNGVTSPMRAAKRTILNQVPANVHFQCPIVFPEAISQSDPNMRPTLGDRVSSNSVLRDTWTKVEDIDHGQSDDVDTVVEHRHNECDNEWCRKLSSIVTSEQMRRAELKASVRKSLPNTESCNQHESDDYRCNDGNI
jgi:hypothetical protein